MSNIEMIALLVCFILCIVNAVHEFMRYKKESNVTQSMKRKEATND